MISCLVNLADIYAQQQQFSFAEPLYKPLIRIVDKTPKYSAQVTPALSQYSALLKATGKLDQVKEIDEFIKVVQEKALVDSVTLRLDESSRPAIKPWCASGQ